MHFFVLLYFVCVFLAPLQVCLCLQSYNIVFINSAFSGISESNDDGVAW